MKGRERDLGGADQEEVVLRDLVDLVAVAGQEAGPVEGLFADQDRRDHRLVALAADKVERVADQRQLDQDEVALEVGEPRAGDPRRRLDVDQAELGADLEVVERLEIEARPLAHLAEDDGVLLGQPVGRLGVGQVGQRRRRPARSRPRPPRAPLCRTRSPPSAARPRRPARRPRSPFCFASPICFESVLRSAWAPSIRGSSSRRRASSASSSSTCVAGAAARQRRLDPLGVGADQLQVEHRGPALRARSRRGAAIPRRPRRRTWRRSGRPLRLLRRRRCSAA